MRGGPTSPPEIGRKRPLVEAHLDFMQVRNSSPDTIRDRAYALSYVERWCNERDLTRACVAPLSREDNRAREDLFSLAAEAGEENLDDAPMDG